MCVYSPTLVCTCVCVVLFCQTSHGGKNNTFFHIDTSSLRERERTSMLLSVYTLWTFEAYLLHSWSSCERESGRERKGERERERGLACCCSCIHFELLKPIYFTVDHHATVCVTALFLSWVDQVGLHVSTRTYFKLEGTLSLFLCYSVHIDYVRVCVCHVCT